MGLECRQITFRWPGIDPTAPPLIEAVDAEFPEGTVSLVSGSTGAGKSTLLHLLAGLLHPTAGTVLANGRPVSRWPPPQRDLWRREVGIVFQHLALPTDLTVAENLLLPLIPGGRPWAQQQAAVQRQLERWDLADLRLRHVHQLSGGQRQRVAVARAMVASPRYLLMDEPTAFQDDHQAGSILDRLRAAADAGATVLVCSHDDRVRRSRRVDERFRLAGRSLLADNGRRSTP